MRLAALADLHFAKNSQGALQPLLAEITGRAEALAICGDLTHHGLPDEAVALVKELAAVRIPMIAVLGNHDHHSGQGAEVQRILSDGGIHVLDGDTFELAGVGFAGVKGFAGGFGRRMLEPWGEGLIQQFARESAEEALKLDSALARLKNGLHVALLHYAPIDQTVEGEPREIYPFLGSGRLEEPLNRHQVAIAFHGHAHHGRLEGRTTAGVPVYNVSMPMLERHRPDHPPYRLLELTAEKQVAFVD